MQVQRVSELTPEPIAWLWRGRLALGKLTLLDGDPGLGKSLIALDLCARLSTGRSMPDGTEGLAPCNVLILESEDGQRDTVRPRLQALGAELDRVFVIRRDEQEDLPRLPGKSAALEAVVADTNARLLVIDPVVAFLEPGVLTSVDQSVRRALLPLAQLAERNRCAVLLLRHLNKRGGRALYRGGGSIGFQGACRMAWLLAEDTDAPQDRRVLAQVKNNLAPLQPSLSLELRNREGALAELAWLGTIERSADALLAKAAQLRELLPCERAMAFLREFLRDGPQATRAIWEAAVSRGFSTRTLQRARKELNIRKRWQSENGLPQGYWSLPEHERASTPEDDPNSLDEWLLPLIEKYPPPTPLDTDD